MLALQEWQANEQYWTSVLAELTRNFPPETEVQVSSLAFNTRFNNRSNERTQTMTLGLRMATASAVNRLAEKLADLGFIDVRPGRTSESSMKGPYSFDSSITAILPPRKPAPPDDEVEAEASPPAPAAVEESAADAPTATPTATSGPAALTPEATSEAAPEAASGDTPAAATTAPTGVADDAEGGRP